MNCETCGNPIDRQDAERGSCAHCGAVLAHVLRAAEKAELVRRVVAQGTPVRIEGDRIEAGAPPGPRREGPEGSIYEARPIPFGVAAALGLTLATGVLAYVMAVRRAEPAPPPTPRGAGAVIAEPLPTFETPTLAPREPPLPTSIPVIKGTPEPPAKLPANAHNAPTAIPRSVEGVVAANKARYERCQREELARNASAARRYSVAITVDTHGRAEWVELLSEASAPMKSCVQAVTRGLDFPKPAAGSTRSIVTLSLTGTP